MNENVGTIRLVMQRGDEPEKVLAASSFHLLVPLSSEAQTAERLAKSFLDAYNEVVEAGELTMCLYGSEALAGIMIGEKKVHGDQT